MADSVQVQKVGWWHERLADLMIAHPHATLGEIARHLGKSQAWISIVKNSDVFVDYWKRRSGEHSAAVTDGVKNKGFAAAELALDHLLAKLDAPEATLMPAETLLSIVDINMKRFGYDNTAQRPPVFNFNLGAATPEQLAEARQRLRSQPITDVESTPALPAPSEAKLEEPT